MIHNLKLYAVLLLLTLFIGIFSVTGCSNVSDSSGTTTSGESGLLEVTTGKASSSQTASYSAAASPNIIEVSGSTQTLTISGLTSGQEIYLAKTNPTATTVASGYSRYIKSASGMSLNKATASTSAPTPPSTSSGSSGQSSWNCYIPPEFELDASLELARSAVSTVEQIAGQAGDTLDIYVDHGYSSSTLTGFSQEAATLRAVGSYCYVWIVDTSYAETASGEYVDDEVAEKVAAQFDVIYPMVRTVFGEESDYLLTSELQASYPMASCSPTASKVNIVLYDIADDYSTSSVSSTGIAGYFHSKDYFYAASSISNKGKYFYVDAAYANENINDIYSTLAHEFQHMIHFGVKYIDQGLSSGTGYNEMLSMLCEDMMEAYFESALDGFDEEASPQVRLPYFNALYYYSGLEYRTTSTAYTLCSYATNYAFGAWLLRNYGGIPLLAEMSANSSVDTDSIVAAVNSVKGTSLTMTDLLKAFATACIFEGSGSGFNIAVDALTSGSSFYYSGDSSATSGASAVSYGYPLEAIDLWTLDELLPDYYEAAQKSTNAAYYKFDGPDMLKSNEYIEVRPYGILLHDLGEATASTVSLTFSSAYSSSLKMYVIIE